MQILNGQPYLYMHKVGKLRIHRSAFYHYPTGDAHHTVRVIAPHRTSDAINYAQKVSRRLARRSVVF